MNFAFPSARKSGFTLVELLLALALGVLVAGILATLIHSLLAAGNGQSSRVHGPLAARSVLRSLSREIACAFAPPIKDLAPLRLSTSTEVGKPKVLLAFYAPVPAGSGVAGSYDIEQVTYEVIQIGQGLRELRRIAAPCSGPFTNALVTNLLLNGRFTLAIEAITNGATHAEWPPPKTEKAILPASMSLSLSLVGEDTIQTEVLIQAANGIASPVDRKDETPEAE